MELNEGGNAEHHGSTTDVFMTVLTLYRDNDLDAEWSVQDAWKMVTM